MVDARNSLIAHTVGNESWYGGTNLDGSIDPLFQTSIQPAEAPTINGDAHLQFQSIAIDAGNNSFIAPISVDLDDNPRIANSVVDLGPYERQ